MRSRPIDSNSTENESYVNKTYLNQIDYQDTRHSKISQNQDNEVVFYA